MRTSWKRLALAAWFAASAARVAGAATGTCTITNMIQPNLNLGLNFGVPIAQGIALGVEFDEAAGTFNLVRDPWYAAFGDLGAQFNTVSGDIHGFLRMANGTTPGTIDGNGEVAIPDLPVSQSTDYLCASCDPNDASTYPTFPVVGLDLMTGLQVQKVAGKAYVMEGEPLNFSTGVLHLYGTGILSGAPGGGGDNLSGIDMKCTMSPIPSQSSLAKGATIAKAAGKTKIDATPEDGDKGDVLTLKAALAPGATAFDLTGASPFILRVGGLTVLVPKSGFQVKGKRLLVKRDDTCKVKKGETTGVCKADGTTSCTSFKDCEPLAKLQIVEGQKGTADTRSQAGGQLVIAGGKKSTAVTLKLQGLDLSTVSGAQTLRVAIGRVTASKAVTGSGTSLK